MDIELLLEKEIKNLFKEKILKDEKKCLYVALQLTLFKNYHFICNKLESKNIKDLLKYEIVINNFLRFYEKEILNAVKVIKEQFEFMIYDDVLQIVKISLINALKEIAE